MGSIKLGTCSWNYPSWVGLVYSSKKPKAEDYLAEYARKYDTVEIDSWFYRIPEGEEVKGYLSQVPDTFTFTCKMVEDVTLTHKRDLRKTGVLEVNPDFLSPDLFFRYIEAITPMLPRIEGIILEFEYLNKLKMESLPLFIEKLDSFISRVGKGLPLAVETRNKNYLTEEYFRFLDERNLIPVFSEKLYMPPIYEVYEMYKPYVRTKAILRLLGGDRKQMEEKTKEQWNRIVDPRNDKERIVDMSLDLKYRGCSVIINVNNHYEGSAPLTIQALKGLMEEREHP